MSLTGKLRRISNNINNKILMSMYNLKQKIKTDPIHVRNVQELEDYRDRYKRTYLWFNFKITVDTLDTALEYVNKYVGLNVYLRKSIKMEVDTIEQIRELKNIQNIHNLRIYLKNPIEIFSLRQLLLWKMEFPNAWIAKYELKYDNIKDLSIFSNVHTLRLVFCSKVKNLKPIQHAHMVSIIGCDNIVNVSPLKYVHTIHLWDCYNIRDITMLNTVNTLYLRRCPNISEVRPLKLLPCLIIKECIGIDNTTIGISDIIYTKPLQYLECPICMCDIDTKYIYLPCFHAFHEDCIRNWFHYKNTCTCPVCNVEFQYKSNILYKNPNINPNNE